METALVAQIGQLNKQLAYYKSLVAQHQEFFSEVYSTLSADESRRLVGLQKKCRQLAARSNPSATGMMQQLHDDPHQERDVTQGGEGLSEDAIKKASNEAANKIQVATVKLLGLWADHLRSNVENLLQQPDAAFETFHETPTNESLEEFLGTYRNTAENIRDLFSKSTSSSSCASALGPKGNPFEMDDRLLNLYKVTIEEAVTSQIPLSSEGTTAEHEHATPPPKARSTQPTHHTSSSSPQPQGKPTGQGSATGGNAGSSTGVSRRPLGLRPSHHEDSEEGGPHSTAAAAGKKTTTGQRSSKEPVVGRLNTRALQQQVAETPQQERNTFTTPVPARVGTPRHSGMSNNSSQMRTMLGGGAPESEFQRPSTPQVPFEELPRLQQLKHTLQQLEVQLSAVSSAGRDSGSESKYYALSKKLQRVRAEVLKEQREQELLEKSNKEVAQQKQVRDDRRRVFHR